MMEEIMSMIFHGFKQVKDLESNLPNQSPEIMSTSLEAIAKTFGEANERLKTLLRENIVGPEQRPETQLAVSGRDQILFDPSLLQEYYWLRCGVTQATDAMIQTQLMAAGAVGKTPVPAAPEGSGGQLQRLEGSDSGAGTSASSTPSQRRRKEEGELQTIWVAAPTMGNTEIPPDDGYTWRKYGQKEILGSRFTRAYYRCTHQKLYNCPAKKQVQRLDDDPYTFRVTYRGSHTCHVSTTMPMSSSTAAAATSAGRFGKEVDYPAVADMAAAMFNAGSSSSNIDFMFFSDHHHNDNQNRDQRSDRRHDGDK